MSQANDKQNIRIQSRVDTPENWKASNPILLEREIGYETDGKYKIGDGITQWNLLPYAASGNLNLENGEGENSLQQKLSIEYFQIYNNPEVAELITKGEIIGEISEDGNRMDIKTGAFGDNSIAINGRSQAGKYAYAEGNFTLASGEGSHAEGWHTIASGDTSHTEGNNTIASGDFSHAEGHTTIASGDTSHAEGWHTIASGHKSHAEGVFTLASGHASHAEGYQLDARGELKISGLANTLTYSITEELDTYTENFLNSFLKSNEYNPDYRTIQCSYQSIVFNITNIDLNQKTLTLERTLSNQDLNNEIIEIDFWTTASGWVSHAEGGGTIADGSYSHAEGGGTIADGSYSHAEGYETIASGWGTHVEGCRTIASEYCSHAEGYHTIAEGSYQHVQGKYNIPDTTSAFIIGNGSGEDEYDETTGELIQQNRSNAMTVDRNGNAWFAKGVYVGGNSIDSKEAINLLSPFNGKNPGLVPGTSNYNPNVYLAGDGTWKEIKFQIVTGASIMVDNAIEGSIVSVNGLVNNELVELEGFNVNNIWSFPVPNYGKWTVNIACAGQIITKEVDVIEDKKYIITGVYDNFEDNTWDVIIAACQDSNFKIPWKVGDEKPMFIKDSIESETGKYYNVRIIGKHHDEYTNDSSEYNSENATRNVEGTGKYAQLTFQLRESFGDYAIHTSTNYATSWYNSSMNRTILPNIKMLLEENIQKAIKNVLKPTEVDSQNFGTGSSRLVDHSEDLFLLSYTEVTGRNEIYNYYLGGALYAGSQYEYYAAGNPQGVGWTRTHNCNDSGHNSTDRVDFMYITGSSISSVNKTTKKDIRFAFCF